MTAVAEVYEGFDAMGRLDSLSLTSRVLQEAALWAYQYHASQVTDNEPVNSRGLTMYFKATRALRERLSDQGWTKDDPYGQARTVHPDKDIAIICAGGNENTGLCDFNPTTTSPKGTMAAAAVPGQRTLFDVAAYVAPMPGPQLWYLLMHASKTELRLELSRPLVIRKGGVISEWAERVIIPSMPFQEFSIVGTEDSGPGPLPIDVEVRRRIN